MTNLLNDLKKVFGVDDDLGPDTDVRVRYVPKRRVSGRSKRRRPIFRETIRLTRPHAYWRERGWTRQGDTYIGPYKVNGRSFAGIARQKTTGTGFDFWIIDPPVDVQKNPCFRLRDNGWWWVHWLGSKPPKKVGAGIVGVERKIERILYP